MPYIPQEERARLDPSILALAVRITERGQLAYVIFKLLCYLTTRPNFAKLSSWWGEAQLAVLEFKRRRIDPYEDRKIEENGDV